MSKPSNPPAVIASAIVLEYALVDESVVFEANNSVLVEGKPLGAVPCLAVGKVPSAAEFLLLYCDQDWAPLADAGYGSLALAKQAAERHYHGLSARWAALPARTAEEAEALLDEYWGADRCSFCGVRPDQADNFIFGKTANICSKCIKSFKGQL